MKEQLKNQIRYKENLIKEYTEFKNIIEKAIDDFIKNKFKKLFNAFEKYGRHDASPEIQFEYIKEAWGQDCISDRTFKNLENLYREYENYGLGRSVNEVVDIFASKIRQNERDLHYLKKEYEFCKD